jgi:hypothetical protein
MVNIINLVDLEYLLYNPKVFEYQKITKNREMNGWRSFISLDCFLVVRWWYLAKSKQYAIVPLPKLEFMETNLDHL